MLCIFSFMGKFGCLGIGAEGTRGLRVSIPGIPLKISALQKYHYSFIQGSQTLTSPAAVSSSPLHPSLNDSCSHFISFVVKKLTATRTSMTTAKNSQPQNDPGKVRGNPLMCASQYPRVGGVSTQHIPITVLTLGKKTWH